MAYKIIFSDLDGTIGRSDYTYSSENIAAIERAKKHGIDVVLCSGRTPISLVHVGEIMNINATYAVGFNGGVVWHVKEGRALFKMTMDRSLALSVVSLIQHKTSAAVGAYIEPDIFITTNLIEGQLGLSDEGIKAIKTDNLLPHIDRDILKILIVGEPSDLEILENIIKNEQSGQYTLVYTAKTMLEVMAPNVNKGVGMAWLSNYLNIPLEQTVGVGDNYNDIELIQKTGLGIAVANAVEPLKKVADYITKRDNNNSALAEVVDYIISKNTGGTHEI